jgi:hypothetical protein
MSNEEPSSFVKLLSVGADPATHFFGVPCDSAALAIEI